MRNVAVALTLGLSVFGCGDNGSSNKPDMSKMGDGGGSTDMSVSPRDLTAGTPAGKACGTIFSCVFSGMSNCTTGKPQPSVDKLQTLINCARDVCGLNDGGANTVCATGMMTTDMGIARCNDCVFNTMEGPMGVFLDSSGTKLQDCSPPNAPECGVCVPQAQDCLFECYADGDCKDITSGGNPTTCMGAEGLTTAGTCG